MKTTLKLLKTLGLALLMLAVLTGMLLSPWYVAIGLLVANAYTGKRVAECFCWIWADELGVDRAWLLSDE